MPDPIVGRESLWIPFMREELKIGENSIIVGKNDNYYDFYTENKNRKIAAQV